MARICGGGVSSVDAMQIAMREPGHEEVVGRIKTWEQKNFVFCQIVALIGEKRASESSQTGLFYIVIVISSSIPNLWMVLNPAEAGQSHFGVLDEN